MKKYKTILADPPWPIGSMVLKKWKSPLDDKYPTMTMEDIKWLNVRSIAADDCSLFLWTTHTVLKDALDVMKHWGFKYHCILTWDKGGGWCVAGFYRRTELVLVGYKGRITKTIKQRGRYIPTLFAEKKTTHSTKPQIMYQLLEERTYEPRIELFARNKRVGWDVWGNEVESDIKL